jgi:hypothetical protein
VYTNKVENFPQGLDFLKLLLLHCCFFSHLQSLPLSNGTIRNQGPGIVCVSEGSKWRCGEADAKDLFDVPLRDAIRFASLLIRLSIPEKGCVRYELALAIGIVRGNLKILFFFPSLAVVLVPCSVTGFCPSLFY